MKKSDQYLTAQLAVVDANIPGVLKLEVLETLMSDRKVALWSEEQEAKAKVEQDAAKEKEASE